MTDDPGKTYRELVELLGDDLQPPERVDPPGEVTLLFEGAMLEFDRDGRRWLIEVEDLRLRDGEWLIHGRVITVGDEERWRGEPERRSFPLTSLSNAQTVVGP